MNETLLLAEAEKRVKERFGHGWTNCRLAKSRKYKFGEIVKVTDLRLPKLKFARFVTSIRWVHPKDGTSLYGAYFLYDGEKLRLVYNIAKTDLNKAACFSEL